MGTEGRAHRLSASRAFVVVVWALAAVLAGSVASWAVSVIGSEQGTERNRVLGAAAVAAALAAATTSPAPVASATSTPASVAPDPTSGPTSVPSTQPSAEPSHAPSHAPSRTPAPTATEVARTWDVPGGQIDVSCRGAVLTLLGARPLDGWTVEVTRNDPGGIEAEFHREGSESTVRAVCVSGVPTRSADTSEGAADDSSSG